MTARDTASTPTSAATDAGFRDIRVTVQLSRREAETVRAAAEREHLPVAAYLRSVALKAAEGAR